MNHLRTIGTIILERHPLIFSLEQIMKDARIDRKLARDTLWTLCEEGLIKLIAKRKKAEKEYGQPPSYVFFFRIANKKALAERVAPKQFENTAQDKVWFVVRHKKIFTARDLIILSGVQRGTVRWYMKALRKIGVIQTIGKGGPGCEWRLIKDPGPKRPYIGEQIHSKRIAHSERR
jgi:predicted transcriptional regulator